MDYFEMKTMSRHTDVCKLAQNLAEFEGVMCRVSNSQSEHESFMQIWELINLLAKQFSPSQAPSVCDVLKYQFKLASKH